MDRLSFSSLSPRQRFFLAQLIEGAQGIRRFGNFEAYRETGGRVVPAGVALNPAEFRGLVDVVPGLRLETSPAPTQVGVYAWLPAMYRPACADLLTQSMRSDHLRVGPIEDANAGGGDCALGFERQRG